MKKLIYCSQKKSGAALLLLEAAPYLQELIDIYDKNADALYKEEQALAEKYDVSFRNDYSCDDPAFKATFDEDGYFCDYMHAYSGRIMSDIAQIRQESIGALGFTTVNAFDESYVNSLSNRDAAAVRKYIKQDPDWLDGLDYLPSHIQEALDNLKTIKSDDPELNRYIQNTLRVAKALVEPATKAYQILSKPVKTSAADSWKTFKETLENSTYNDPIYEGQDGGDVLEDMIGQAATSLHITIEPSIQGGQGSQIFYDDDDNVLGECDYADFNHDIIDIALESSNKRACRTSIKNYIKSLISD